MKNKKSELVSFENNAAFSRYVATQGMVLLENRNQVLPLKTKKIALFGGGAYATVKGGTGSGNVSNSYEISIYQGFKNAGYYITNEKWIDNFGKEYDKIQKEDVSLSMIDKFWSGIKIDVPDLLISAEELKESSGADTAIYVITRNTGENFDRTESKGDYLLSDTELENIRMISEKFDNSIVVLNTCVIDTNFFHEIEKLDGLLVMSQAGMEGGTALVEVLSGLVTPSGKLTDTWAKNYCDYPASKTFSENDCNSLQENYEEGIYVGYRYFDTFNITPQYEFGYGLSYTEFAIDVTDVYLEQEELVIKTSVTNIGKAYTGKEVVQVYFSAPTKELDKPYQELVAFGKTRELAQGESQILSFRFSCSKMSSYSEALAARILEMGDYTIRVGNSSRNTKVVAIVRLDETIVTEQLSNQLTLDQEFNDISSKGSDTYSYDTELEEVAHASVLNLDKSMLVQENNASQYSDSITTYLIEGSEYQSKFNPRSSMVIKPYEEKFEYVKAIKEPKLYDVYNGNITMEEFVAQLDIETLATLVNGEQSSSQHKVEVEHPIEGAMASLGVASGATTKNFVHSYGIPNTILADGPAGLHIPPKKSDDTAISVNYFSDTDDSASKINPFQQSNCTAFPVGMLLAQTWDMEVIWQVGEAFGKEMVENDISVVLAPGMNIHRDPLCGRNFEYYSEDPLLTGMCGAKFTLGVQSIPGIGVSIKHFAANNQEINRIYSNSSVSERALREIYLKGFEIAVKSAQPMTVMTSYNKLNGIYTSSRYDLCTHVLRGEWAFKGYVMTDWGSQSNKAQDMHAGNDMIMDGNPISIMTNAVLAPNPIFRKDGRIEHAIVSFHGGYFTKEVENWGSFMLDQNGSDVCIAEVEAGVEVNEKITTLVDEKKAKIIEHNDGTKTIEYYGNDLGAFITLGDLQKSVINFLNVIIKSKNMQLIYNPQTQYKKLEIKSYNYNMGQLAKNFSVDD